MNDPNQLITNYRKDFDLDKYFVSEKACHSCNSQSKWSVHEIISRGVRYFFNDYVHKVSIPVACLMCSFCKRTFRHLPDFIEPFKRFMTCSIEYFSKIQLKPKRKKYRDTVKHDSKQPIFYYSHDEISYQKLSHSSVWRWVRWCAIIFTAITNQNPQVANQNTTDLGEEVFCFHPLQALSKNRFSELKKARIFLFSRKFKKLKCFH